MGEGMLSPDDPGPVIVENAGGASAYVIVCDHAGQAIPRRLEGLGVSQDELDRHIGWDIGAAGVASRLGAALGACVVRQAYSRLVADCNRSPARADIAPAVSDGTRIPGNEGLTAEALRTRVEEIHRPYHDAIAAALTARQGRAQAPILVSVHSFTPSMNGVARPWDIGVLHQGDSPRSLRLLEQLRAEPGLVVGDNEPYALGEIDYTIPTHAQAQGLDYQELEIRQDLIEDAEGQMKMATLLARLLAA
jgi:predicted N-formylglutamate amidohydrolase